MDPPMKILVIEADESFSKALARMLMVWGYDPVMAADSGPAALDGMAHTEFDVVLLDIHPSGTDALRLVGEIRGKWPKADIVTMSTLSTLGMEVGLREAGVFHHHEKPFSAKDLELTLADLDYERAFSAARDPGSE
jgi:DNA-binding NtrC family response regulator